MSGEAPRPPLELVPRFADHGYGEAELELRRRFLEERTGARLEHVARHSMPGESMRGNIENPIGAAQVPLGVAGPLVVNGEHARSTFYVPLATTEGAMLRSYERGMATLAHAGGIDVRLVRDENRVSPSFHFDSIVDAAAFPAWIDGATAEIRALAESTTRHGRLLELGARPHGRQVVVDFRFSTGDASGMNLMVRAVEHAARWIVASSSATGFEIFSGAESEKRASAALWEGGKGKWLVAGARVPAAILRRYLRVDAAALGEYARRSLAVHVASGTSAHNGQLANGLAAIFIACGQDVANVVNAATGVTLFEELPGGDLYASLTLPALTLGTVGGGTALATSRECLELLGCFGAGQAPKLAEIVAATLLAGELSMVAAITAGEHGAAHDALGRNRPPESAPPAGTAPAADG